MKKLILFIAIGILGSVCEARTYPKLTRYVDENVGVIAQAVNTTAKESPMNLGGGYEFRRFNLRIQAKAGFDVEFGKVVVVPELELVFQKETELD